jgi:3'-5' exoribonuclease
MDPIGMYVGHIPYGTMLLAKMLETEHISLPIADVHQLMHNILCHHDKLEWGACVMPATMEGHLIHIVDFLDSRYERTEEIK